MGLGKLVSLLSRRQMFFTRLGALVSGDPFEGAFPQLNFDIDLIWFATVNDESTQFVIAPTIDQARIIFGYCVKLLFASPILSKFAKPPVLSPFPKIELLNGSTIHARGSGQTASDSHLGGHGADRIIADEAAFIPHSILAEVIPPMLAASLYGELCLISTPFGLNHFYEAWQRGQRGEDGCASFNFSSWANPKLEPAYLESQRAVVLAVRRQVLTKHRGLVRAQSSMLAKSSRIWCIPCGLWRQCDEAPAATGQLTGSQQDRIVRAFTRRKLQRAFKRLW